MPSHMNVFEPYERSPHHEDQLTRAFLIVLKAVPVAHEAWLRLTDHAHRAASGLGLPSLHDLPAPEVETQRGAVPMGVSRLVSILQTDERIATPGPIGASERTQVLDGLVTYGSELALAIENKPDANNVWFEQLKVNLGEEAAKDVHDPVLACVTWSAIVQAWNRLLDHAQLGVAEAVLVSDFLDLVEEHFPMLLPYSTIESCGSNVARLERRCHRLLEEIAGGENVHQHRGWANYIGLAGVQPATRIALIPAAGSGGQTIRLEIDPGDTLSQARALYDNVAPAAVLRLEQAGWSVRPNFHFSFRASNLLWTKPSLSVAQYWSYWAEGAGQTWFRQVQRGDWERLLAALVSAGIMGDGDRSTFDVLFTKTGRNNANICPGLTLTLDLPIEEAAVLDDRRQLSTHLAKKIGDAVEALRLVLPSRSST